MTKQQKDYIKKQLHIIQDKKDEVELRHYEVLLGAAKLDPIVLAPLRKACDIRHDEFRTPTPPMAVNGDIDDIH